jgi:hypothetical protein
MRMVSVVVIIIGIVLIMVSVRDNLGFVINEIKGIGTTTGTGTNQPKPPQGPNPAGGCIDKATGIFIPCTDQFTGVQQNIMQV